MSEISVGIACRRYSFVHLGDMHVLPQHILVPEIAKHHPRGFATTYCPDKFAASRNRISRFFSDELRGLAGDSVGIGIDFDVHQAASLATASAFLSPGLLQPPVGATRSTSFGPQVPGAY